VIAAIPFSALRHIVIKAGLPGIQEEAIQQLTYAPVSQVHMVVDKPFWQGQGVMPNVWTDTVIGRIFAGDPAGTGEITNLTFWVNGQAALNLDKLPEEEVRTLALSQLEKIMPGSKDSVRVAKTISWQKSRFAGGSWACWSPGQVSRYADAMAKPAGNLYFAGEHTSRAMPGMEGALESGERAAMEVYDSA
jgi:monoamine oxidase